MLNKIRSYIDDAFSEAPKTRKAEELKDELYSNLAEKYQDQIAKGRTEQEAYNNAIGGIGDISELVESVKTQSGFELTPAERKKSALVKSVAVALYIICAVPVFIFQNELGIIYTLVIVALATGMLIYNGVIHPDYKKQDDSIVEEFKEWRVNNENSRRAYRFFHSAYWGIVVAAYLLFSFIYGHWGYTWIIFIIAAAIENVIKGFIQLSGGDDEK